MLAGEEDPLPAVPVAVQSEWFAAQQAFETVDVDMGLSFLSEPILVGL